MPDRIIISVLAVTVILMIRHIRDRPLHVTLFFRSRIIRTIFGGLTFRFLFLCEQSLLRHFQIVLLAFYFPQYIFGKNLNILVMTVFVVARMIVIPIR